MTELLRTAFLAAQALPDDEQDALAAIILAEIDDERRWAAAFRRSPEVLAELAAEALAEHRAKYTLPLDRRFP
jgi:hypothetical protein